MEKTIKICSRCVLDTTVPFIKFDEKGECDYCHAYDETVREYPNDERGQKILDAIVATIKANGRHKKYDCIVGVSGGTDSTYLLYWAKNIGLRPLAVQCDNGWCTEISVRNIKNATSLLDIDLYTYVLDWDEFKDLQASFLRSSIEDADTPTDIAIRAVLYRVAAKEDISYFLVGNDFRSEGKVPIYWSYGDGQLIKSIQKKYGHVKLKSFPNLTIQEYIYYGLIKGIKQIRPFWYMPYKKEEIRKLLVKELNWEYYGGHHFENIFTRFFQGYYLPTKFGYDKRKVEFSALIRSGQICREEALQRLKQISYPPELVKQDLEYVRKKLGFSEDEFNQILTAPPRSFVDHKSDLTYLIKYRKLFTFAFKFIYSSKPQLFYYLENLNLSQGNG